MDVLDVGMTVFTWITQKFLPSTILINFTANADGADTEILQYIHSLEW